MQDNNHLDPSSGTSTPTTPELGNATPHAAAISALPEAMQEKVRDEQPVAEEAMDTSPEALLQSAPSEWVVPILHSGDDTDESCVQRSGTQAPSTAQKDGNFEGDQTDAVEALATNTASQEGAVPSAPSSEVIEVPFDWEHEPKIDYLAPYGIPWHQVAYRETPSGRQVFERGIPIQGESNEWTDDMSLVKRVPYNVAEVLRRKVIIFVEGEESADFLNKKLRGAKNAKAHWVTQFAKAATATTTAGGLGRVNNTNITFHTFNKIVVVLPTNDLEGMRHAHDVCRNCSPNARFRRIVELPNRSAGGGVEQFFQADGTIAQLIQLIEDAPEWTP